MPGLCCVILGMHRSGTSCLARILNRAGLVMGDDLMLDPEIGNLIGHWETIGAVEINDRILARSPGGQWDRIPPQLLVEQEDHDAIDAFLRRFAGSPVFGWKDPRMTLTLPIWRPHLGNYRLLACFRHPYAVARSLHEREGRWFDASLELWAEYNERLLSYVADEPEVFWFPYDDAGEAYWNAVRAVCGFSGLQFTPELLKLYNPSLTHHRGEPEIAEPRIREIYTRLVKLARESWSARSASPLMGQRTFEVPAMLSEPLAAPAGCAEETASQCLPASAPEGGAVTALADVNARIGQMSEALQGAYHVHHKDHKAVLGLLEKVASLDREIAGLREREVALTQTVARLDRSNTSRAHLVDEMKRSTVALGESVEELNQWVVLRTYRSMKGLVRALIPRRSA